MNKTCPSNERLGEFLDGTLPADDEEALAAHINRCSACIEQLDALTRLDEIPSSGLGLPIGGAETPRSESSEAIQPESTSGLHRLRGLIPRDDPAPDEELEFEAAEASPDLPTFPGYQTLAALGRGGMGIVYKARDRRLNRIVAIKQIKNIENVDPSVPLRFRLEGETLGRLDHPNIVRIHELGTDAHRPFIVLEYVEAGSLDRLLEVSELSHHESAGLVAALAAAMDHAHRKGVAHRDLKPANVLLASRTIGDVEMSAESSGAFRGLPWIPKITDFGLAKQFDSDLKLTETGVLAGTPCYMAPEQVRGGSRDKIGPAVDVYALGAILYECLTRKPPHVADNSLATARLVLEAEPTPPRALRPAIPRDLETICLRCLEKEPASRYASAADLAEDLRRFLLGLPILARQVGPIERAWKWARRYPIVAMLLLTIALSMLAGTGVSTYFAFEADRRAVLAKRLEGEAIEAGKTAVAAKLKSDRVSSSLLFKSGLSHLEEGRVTQGLFTLLQAWRTSPPEDAETVRVIRTNLAAWLPQLPVLSRYQDFRDPEAGRLLFVGDGSVYTLERGAIRKWNALEGRPEGDPVPLPEPIRSHSIGTDRFATTPILSPDGKLSAFHVAGRFRFVDMLSGEPIGQPFESGTRLHKKFIGNRRFAIWNGPSSPEIQAWSPDQANWDKPDFVYRSPAGSFFGHYPVRGEAGEELLALVADLDTPPDAERAKVEFLDPNTGKHASSPRRLRTDNELFRWGDGVGLSLDSKGRLGFHDPETGRRLWEPWMPRRGFFTALSEDGRSVFSKSSNSGHRVVDVATGWQRGGEILDQFENGGIGQATLIDSVFGSRLTYFRYDGTARVWRYDDAMLQSGTASNPISRTWPRVGEVDRFKAAVFHPPTRAVMHVDADRDFAVVTDWRTGRPIGPPLRSQTSSARFTPDGRRVVSVSRFDREAWVRSRDVETGKDVMPPRHLPKFIYASSLAPDGRTLAVGCVGRTCLIDVERGKILHELHESSVGSGLAFSPDGRKLAVAYQFGWQGVGAGFRIWDTTDGKSRTPFLRWKEISSGVDFLAAKAITFIEGGRRVFVALPEHLMIRDGETGEIIGEPLYVGQIGAAAVSPDLSRVAVAAEDRGVRQWSLPDFKELGPTMETVIDAVRLQYSPDGRTLAVVLADGSARNWDGLTSLPIGFPYRGRTTTAGIAFEADGGATVPASADGDYRVRPLPSPIADDPDRFERRLSRASGYQFMNDRLSELPRAAWERLGDEFEPPREGVPPERFEEWVREAEFAGNGRAALKLIEGSDAPKSTTSAWLTHLRRYRIHAALGNEALARDAFAEARRIATSSEVSSLINTIRRYETLATASGRWIETKSHLDRLADLGLDHWRLDEDRASAFVALGRPTEADAARRRFLDRCDDPVRLVELADEAVTLDEWGRAAGYFRRALDLGIAAPRVIDRLARTYLRLGDVEGYRRLREAVVREAASSDLSIIPEYVDDIVGLAGLAPGGSIDWSRLINLTESGLARLAERRGEGIQTDRQVLHERLSRRALLLFRAGKHREADEEIQKAIATGDPNGRAFDRLVSTMILHALGKTEESREALAEARRFGTADLDAWDRIGVECLTREAEALAAGATSGSK